MRDYNTVFYAILKWDGVAAITDTWRKQMAIGNNNLTVDLLKELEDNDLKIITALVNNIYMSEVWPKDFYRCYDDCINKEKSNK